MTAGDLALFSVLFSISHHAVDALQVLKQRDFPYSNLKFLASSRYILDMMDNTQLRLFSSNAAMQYVGHTANLDTQWCRSAGKEFDWDGSHHTIEELKEDR